jgi:hypothetical protein
MGRQRNGLAWILVNTRRSEAMEEENLTFTTAVNDCIIQQLNYIKRFGPKYMHIAGDDNFLANMFSWLACLSDADVPIVPLPKRDSLSMESLMSSLLISPFY